MLKKIFSLIGVYKIYERWLWYQIKNGQKPEHIAIILDGNRRWANDKAPQSPWLTDKWGHKQGADTVEQLLDWCNMLEVKYITLYTFSTENFSRQSDEILKIMQIAEERFKKLLLNKRVHENKVHVKVIGRTNLLPSGLQKVIEAVEKATQHYDNYFWNFAFAYGGRAEIVDASKKIAVEVKEGRLQIDSINEDTFEKYLYTSHMNKQDPDIIIRTSGEERLSGFLLWQAAYSELLFLDVYWPDFRLIDLLRAIRTYQHRRRRFGK
ncbi:MAG: di-trans,poly-cis-decaprenylcistransferase [Nitrososphaerota archaeon]|jgi:tritrans,polycis-undecaprenyl-diphosphate synthase [geranylgeranyl-diphosphate specific]|nr:di-trans,poly-cis-decaprenylcistransferase [Nitrososphaerota archaeon]